MKKIMLTFVIMLLAACSVEDAPAPPPVPETTAPAQNVESDQGSAVDSTQESATLTATEATAIVQDLVNHLRDATEKAGYDTTIEVLQAAWAPYVTTAYFDSVSDQLICEFDYCNAYYSIPNSLAFGWERTFDFVSDDTFKTEALVPNIGDSVGLYSMLESMEVKRENGTWKINRTEFEQRDIGLSEDKVIPYLAQIYDVHIDDFYIDTLENGEFQHDIYVFTHPEFNKEYFVDGSSGTMYERAFFEEFMNPLSE
ncbi:MAG: hypothetical protein ABS951_04750 [Solibacillus sp.]